MLATASGVFAEPAAAAAVAGLLRLRGTGLAEASDRVVVLVTGHGLKDVDAAMRGLRVPAAIRPNARGLEEAAERIQARGAHR